MNRGVAKKLLALIPALVFASALARCGRRARGREGTGQPALRTAERSHHRVGAEKRRAAHRVQRIRARRRGRRSCRQGGRGIADRRPARSRRRQTQRLRIRRCRRRRGRQLQRRCRRGEHFGRWPVPGARSRADDRAAGGRAHAPAFRRGRSSRTTAIARSNSSSRPRIPILRSSSASTAAPRCSASIPSAVPQGGSERSLASLTQGDVVSYHAANFGADRATLVFAGDLDPKWMRQALTDSLRRMGKSQGARFRSSSPRRE